MKKINVLMIDDNEPLIDMVGEYFSGNERISISFRAHDGEEGLKLIKEKIPVQISCPIIKENVDSFDV